MPEGGPKQNPEGLCPHGNHRKRCGLCNSEKVDEVSEDKSPKAMKRTSGHETSVRAKDSDLFSQVPERILSERIVQFENAHRQWLSEAEATRGAFNTGWLHSHGFASLYQWGRSHGDGTIESFIKRVGGSVAEDFEKKKMKKRSLEDAVEELREAHVKWLAEAGENVPFGVGWLRKNNYNNLYNWATHEGGMAALATRAGGEAARDFKIPLDTVRRTLEDAVNELREAHAKWREADTKENFSPSWLRENGYFALYSWSYKHTSLSELAAHAAPDIQADLSIESKVVRTSEDRRLQLEEAFHRWQSAARDTRGKFNQAWLKKNGYADLNYWIQSARRKGADISDIEGFLDKHLEKRKEGERRTLARAVQELNEAHQQWEQAPADTRGKFNLVWLNQHGYEPMFQWVRKEVGLESVLLLVGDRVRQDLEIEPRTKRTMDSARSELSEAYAKWRDRSEEDRGKFNITWLKTNGYSALVAWMEKHAVDFSEDSLFESGKSRSVALVRRPSRESRTEEEADRELVNAYGVWKAIPENERTAFSTAWLINNGFNSLYQWAYSHGGFRELLERASEEIRTDFYKKPEVSLEGIVDELQHAHQKWKMSPVYERQPFNTGWLQRSGYYGLYERMRRNGGIDLFIANSNVEVQADFARNIGDRRQRLVETAKEYATGESLDAKVFNQLIVFCGPSRVVDILYRFRPEYKKIPVDYVRTVLAEYLGDYLGTKRPFSFKELAGVSEHFSDLTLREGLFETIKGDCLSFYYAKRREGSDKADYEIIFEYLDHAVESLGDLKNKDIEDVVESVTIYFQDLFTTIERPRQLVTHFGEGRNFPDVNQLINTRELGEKRRLLIADEMGLGKSGSVIFAKEALGAKRAVVIVPSNVIATWEGYLSDDPLRKGCFAIGEAPKVCVVKSPEQIPEIATGDYDYIVISQERLSQEDCMDALVETDFDMLVVDEAHLLKNLKGKRSKQLLELSKKVEGDDKYLALLTGTPVPNTVRDIAVTLRLLYPENFGDTDDGAMVTNILRGDILDLRSLLLPRMQMKELRDSVEMPELTEDVVTLEATATERQAYEILLEEDELSPTQKMQILRQFLLNPELIDPTPGIESSKIDAVSEALTEEFGSKNKIVLFVNGYVEDVIRGETSILRHIKLPRDVKIKVIHGEVSTVDRVSIQQQFQTGDEKMLLVVSGQTAGVGVDYSAAEEVFFYNEPWTEYERRQQLARVYRPGLAHPLRSRTFIVGGTIEEGIHQHIQTKYKSVEKLLKGIPITELEQQILKRSDQEPSIEAEVNPELAKFYFSAWERMMKIFSHVREIGEADFKEFLEKFAREYADCYLELGSRSYQANANRVSGALIERMMLDGGRKPDVHILDAASGPEMLRRHAPEELKDRIVSMDLNAAHFAKPGSSPRVVGSYLEMPFKSESFDYANLALAWHYTNFVPSQDKFDRLRLLTEINRVLKIGGRTIINMIYSLEPVDRENLSRAVEVFGFRIVNDYSGDIVVGETYKSKVLTLEKIDQAEDDLEKVIARLKDQDLLRAFKLRRNDQRLRDSRGVITEFSVGEKNIVIPLNTEDRKVFDEEQETLRLGRSLKTRYGSIEDIPRSEIIDRGFTRVYNGKRYILFHKLEHGGGAVVVK